MSDGLTSNSGGHQVPAYLCSGNKNNVAQTLQATRLVIIITRRL